MENTIPTDLISTRDAAKLLGGCHISSIFRWVQAGVLPGWRRRGRWFVSRSDCLSMWTRWQAEPRREPLATARKPRSSAWAIAEARRLGIE